MAFRFESGLFSEIELLDSVDSTNAYLRKLAGQRKPRLVVARQQTAGIGQYGRTWFSPPDSGLYVSYLFFPGWPRSWVAYLNPVATLAVKRAIRQVAGQGELALSIKAPNDVLIGGKKVAGVLAEVGGSSVIDWVILGIGVNIAKVAFPSPLRDVATALEQEGVATHPLDFCAILTRWLERLLRTVEVGQGQVLESEYRKETQWGCSALERNQGTSPA